MRLKTTTRHPGKLADDKRSWVTIEEEGNPWPVTFYFVPVEEDDGTQRWASVGVEVGARDFTDGEEVPELPPTELRNVADHFVRWLDLAHYAAVLDWDNRDRVAGRIRRTKPARIDDDWLKMIAAEYEARTERGEPAVSDIARTHDVTRSAASRWVKAARDRGFLPPKERA